MNYHSKKEIWLDIPNYEGYQVSNLGNVRTYNKITFTKKNKARKWKNRILKIKSGKSRKRNDFKVDLWKNNEVKTFLVSRLVAFTFFNKDINDKNLTINHIDGNWKNNELSNLEIISLKENINHAFNNNLYKTNKQIEIIDKSTNDKYRFRSMSKASNFISKNKGYISGKIKKNKYSNNEYEWRIL